MSKLYSATAAHKARELAELFHAVRGGATLLLAKL
jgi:hypothetical protein